VQDARVSEETGALPPLTPVMVTHLRETRPWVFFLSIAGFVGSGLMAILALCLPILFAVADDEEIGLVGGFAIAFLYLLMAAVYFYLSFLLLRYSRAIRDLVDKRAAGAMEAALEWQKRFWRFTGIVMLAVICLYALGFLSLIVIGIMAAVR
jgi:hypothetical protein